MLLQKKLGTLLVFCIAFIGLLHFAIWLYGGIIFVNFFLDLILVLIFLISFIYLITFVLLKFKTNKNVVYPLLLTTFILVLCFVVTSYVKSISSKPIDNYYNNALHIVAISTMISIIWLNLLTLDKKK